jgi:serine/threonine protein kinase
MRKFSPEIVAFIRKCKSGTFDIVESFSGKGADVWAAGLYAWELLEDNTDNLFSTKSVPLMQRVYNYTYEAFEKLVDAINALNKTYSSNLLSLLRQVLTVNPEMRLKTSQVLKMLPRMSDSERKTVFEEIIRLANQDSTPAEEHSTIVYAFADPEMYVEKSVDQQQLTAYLPGNIYSSEEL